MSEAWTSALARVPDLLAAHVQLSFSALLLAMVICLPLAIWAARAPRVAGVILAFASLIQTIPALALLALFYPLLLGLSALLGGGISALGFLPALLALTLYALLPILRNAVTGLTGVDPAAQEAADGLGMTALQKLRLVEAPLAAPTIMAGIRTAAVWTIGAATLSTTVGQASLGDLIFAGLQTQNWTLVLTGCLASAGLAILVDMLLGVIERAIRQRRKIMAWATAAIIATGMLVALIPVLIPAFGSREDAVVIGAKGFSEQFILARLIGARLEDAGYPVAYRDGLGSAVVFQALANGDVDIYVDYSGTIWTNAMERTENIPSADMLTKIAQWSQARHGVTMLGALGFENTYAFAVRAQDAAEKKLATLDDLARIADGLSFGTDLEFLERPEWALVKAAYPIRFAEARSFNPTFMYPALANGEVDVISAFSSDGRIAANGFVVLDDVKGAVPSYEAMLLVSPVQASDEKFLSAVRPLVGTITVEKMREANYMVDRSGNKKTPRQAAQWLDEQIRK